MLFDSTPTLEANPLFLMSIVHRSFRKQAQEKLSEHFDITLEMLAALEVIAHHQPLTQQSLGNKLVTERSATKRHVDNLIKRNLVQVSKHEVNKKSKMLTITCEGKTVSERGSKMMHDLKVAWLSCLDEQDQTKLLSISKQLLISNIETLGTE